MPVFHNFLLFSVRAARAPQSPSEFAPGISLAGPATGQCYKSGVTTAYPWVRVACGAVGQNATLSVYTTQVRSQRAGVGWRWVCALFFFDTAASFSRCCRIFWFCARL